MHVENQNVAVDHTTTDRHSDRYLSNVGTIIGDRVDGDLRGHPYTYELIRATKDGKRLSYRVMFVVVNARAELRILQVAPISIDDRLDWGRLVNSVAIK